jgi:O-antigen ligase
MKRINLSEKTKYLIFQISWVILLLSVICDFSIGTHVRIAILQVNIPKPTLGPAVYIIVLLFMIPKEAVLQVFRVKSDARSITILTVLLASVYLSAFLSQYREMALSSALFRFTLFFLCFIGTVACIYYFKDSANFILKSLIFINLLVVLSSIADFYIPAFNEFLVRYFGHLEPKYSVLKLAGVTYMRPSGFVSDTNLTAFSIVVSCLLLLLNEDNVRMGWFKYIFYGLSGYSFGMLASRSAILALLICLAAFFITKRIGRKRIIVFFAIFFAIQLTTPHTIARIKQYVDKSYLEEEFKASRLVLWKAAWLAFEEHPVTGLGTGIFFVKSVDYMKAVWQDSPTIDPELKEKISRANLDPWNPHNIFLTMLSEEGIIGFVIFVVFLVFLFKRLIWEKRKTSLILISAVLLVSSLSNYAPYYKYYMVLCIALYAGIRQDMKILSNG